ncbi:hypothetical protein HY947_01855 [Candidatus Gottesmanbacteria bacterium]|nr:hypothetical protein [Candidatus Gottesmanbacteria bacterium]
MNTVRTTVTFDTSLYRQLSVQAAVMGLGFSEYLNRKLENPNVGSHTDVKIGTIAKHQTIFRALGKKFGKTNWTKLVRAERNSGHDR